MHSLIKKFIFSFKKSAATKIDQSNGNNLIHWKYDRLYDI